MRVLFLGSSPAAETRLRLDREYREIDAHLRENGSGGASIELVGSWAVRIPDLSRELLRHQPDVVHFSGHGAPDGLLFDTDTDSGRLAHSFDSAWCLHFGAVHHRPSRLEYGVYGDREHGKRG